MLSFFKTRFKNSQIIRLIKQEEKQLEKYTNRKVLSNHESIDRARIKGRIEAYRRCLDFI